MEQKTKTHPKQRSHTEGNTRALYFARNCYVWQSLRWSIVAHETVSRRAEEGWAVRESTHAHRRLDATKSGTDFKIFWARAGVRLSRRRFQEERKYDLKPDVFFEGNEGPKSRAKAMGDIRTRAGLTLAANPAMPTTSPDVSRSRPIAFAWQIRGNNSANRRKIARRSWPNLLFLLVCPEGIEPPTHSLEGCCSIRLSYGQRTADAGFPAPISVVCPHSWRRHARDAPSMLALFQVLSVALYPAFATASIKSRTGALPSTEALP